MDLNEYEIPGDIDDYQKVDQTTTYVVRGVVWKYNEEDCRWDSFLRLRSNGGKEVLMDKEFLDEVGPGEDDLFETGTVIRLRREAGGYVLLSVDNS